MSFEIPSQLRYARESGYASIPGTVRPHRAIAKNRNLRVPGYAAPDSGSIAVSPENLVLMGLPAQMLFKLEPFLTLVDLTKRQFLSFRNDLLNFIYFPVTAVVSEYSMLEDGRMVEIAVTGRDGAVGLSSFLLDSNPNADITQVSHSGTARRIDVRTLAALLSSNPSLRTNLNSFMALYIRQISQRVMCNVYHSARGRLCTWMLMAQDRCGLNTLLLTQDEMAQVLGVFRPTVTCIAQNLRLNKLIDYERGAISIRDRKGVMELACACYSAPTWATN